MTSTPRGPAKGVLLLSTLLVLLTGWIYSPSLEFGFVNLDDDLYVVQNERVLGGLDPGALGWIWAPYETNWIPLTWLSLAADFERGGLDPRVYHQSNLILHMLASVLLLVGLARMTGGVLRSAFVAGLFALHPLHVESVAWISERKDVLSGVFFAAAILAWAFYSEKPSWGRYVLVLLCFVAGLLAKPMLVTLPFVLLLLDVWPLRRVDLGRDQLDTRRLTWLVIEKIPLMALSALAAVVTFVVQGSRGAMAGLEAIPLGDRVSNALLAYVGYLGGALWPARLSVFYPHAGATASPAAVTGALALLVLLTGSALALLRRRPAIAVGWLWFLGMLVPVIGIVQVGEQAMADRYMYLPLIGLGIVAAYGPPESFFEAARRRGAAAALGLLVLLAFAWATHQHLPVWTDGVTLMRQALRSAGPNAFVHMGLGVALQRDEQHREAAQHFEQSLALDPRSAEAWVGLADALASLGDTGAARDAFARAGELPRSPRTQLQLHAGVGHALLTEGEHEEAARQFELALALEPERGRGRLHGLLAQSLFATGRTKEAHRHYRLALAIDPALTKARANFGFALMDAGELDEALEMLVRANAEDPQIVEVLVALGSIRSARGEEVAAVEALQEALQLQPDRVDVLNNLAYKLATTSTPGLRDSKRALRLSRRAAQLTANGSPQVLDTLAVALRATGRIRESLGVLDRALALALEQGDRHLAREIAARRRRYRAVISGAASR